MGRNSIDKNDPERVVAVTFTTKNKVIEKNGGMALTRAKAKKAVEGKNK